jgi:hypothetical protein
MPNIVDYLTEFFDTGDQLRDFQHATRLYLDNNYALAPKTSWMYYVVFSIDPSAITEAQWKNQRRDYEAGMLVKSCDLPKYQIQVDTLNQYNKKTNVQSKITYQPISFSFHDDQSNITNSLWVNYYRYYYRDTWYGQKVGMLDQLSNKPAGYKNNKYQPIDSYTTSPDGRAGTPGMYGLNNNQSRPFFNAITIYQLNQKRFTSYVIINPLITAWEHDQLDNSQTNKFASNKMTVAYETVFYGEGKVRRDAPTGFATFHYDLTPSPLSIAGGGTNTIFGPGGIISGVNDIFGEQDGLLSRGLSGNPLNLIGAVSSTGNLLRNARNITTAGLRAEGQSILNSALQGALGGLGGGATGFLNGGLGSLSSSLGFGPKTGTILVGSNFIPNQATASPGDVAPTAPASTTGVNNTAALEARQNTTYYSSDDIQQLNTEADLSEALDAQTSNAKQIQERLDYSKSVDAEVQQKYKDAIQTSGQAEADAIRAQYASKGYEDPVKLEANLKLNTENQADLERKLLSILEVKPTSVPP